MIPPDRARVLVARRLLPAGLEPLERLFDVRAAGVDASREQLLQLAPGSAAVVSDPTVPVDAELLDACGYRLQVVANFAVGYDNVDLEACRERGVIVTNTPGALTDATAELALALTLAAARRLGPAEADLRAGRWTGWDPAAYRGKELSGATFGIVGMGRIGRRYAELVAGFGGPILYSGPTAKPEAEAELGARRVGLSELLAGSDVVSLHAPATDATRQLIDAAALGEMRVDAILVNTARGSLLDTSALARALAEGRIGAVALDVYENEPEVPRELLEAPNAVLLPHIGSATVASRDRMARLVAENVIAVLQGRPAPNRVEC